MTEKEYYGRRREALLADDAETLELIELEAAEGFDAEEGASTNEQRFERFGNQSASN